MIRIQLDDTTRDELQALRRTDLPAVARDRLEMVLLSDAGWSPPASPGTWAATRTPSGPPSRASPHAGADALYPDAARPRTRPRPPGAGHRPLLRDLLGQDRTWTAGQLAEALRPTASAIGTARPAATWPAEGRLPPDRPDRRPQARPAKVERAEAVLANLKKKPRRAG